MDPQLLAIRKRLRDEFPFYAANALKIRTKAGEIAPLHLNPAQLILQKAIDDQMATEGKVRIIILKARQQGLSTHVGGYMFAAVSQNTAKRAMVITHQADSTRALFDMTKRFHEHCPPILKPKTKYASRRELYFDTLDSSYIVATAGGEAIGRGETLSHLHASEIAFWPKSTAKDIWNGLYQAVPNLPGTVVFIESTANGVSGVFYDMWRESVAGRNGFVPVFIPWFLDPMYRETVPAYFSRSPEEERLVEQYGLDNSQLQFRRIKISANGLENFKQEYPAVPAEAFLTTGRPVFDSEQLVHMIDAAQPRLRTEAYEEDGTGGGKFDTHPRGELTLYREIDPVGTYYIGADTAMGVRGGDWSVATILDSTKTLVGILRCRVHPDFFAQMLYALGHKFNMAAICPESNNHGILTCIRLAKDMGYPYVYTETIYDKLADKDTIKIGFTTTVKSKPLLIDRLRASMRLKEIKIDDKTTLNEMLTYVVTETGSMEAEENCHDDTVVALALANHIHEGSFKPVENQDDYYTEAI